VRAANVRAANVPPVANAENDFSTGVVKLIMAAISQFIDYRASHYEN
jgi:hypothetical protein